MSFLHGRLRGLQTLHATLGVVAVLGLYGLFLLFHPSVANGGQGWNYLVTYPALLAAGIAFSFARASWADSARARLGPRPGEEWPLRATNRHVANAALFVLVGVVFTKHADVSRLFLGTLFPAVWLTLLLVHLLVHRGIAPRLFAGHRTLDTLVIADVADQEPLLEWVRDHNHLGLELSGIYSQWVPPGFEGLDARRFGPTPEDAITRMTPRLVICSDRHLSGERLGRLRLVAESVGSRFAVHLDRVSGIGGFGAIYADGGHAIAVCRREPLESPAGRAVKRAFDIALSLPVVVFVLPPLMALVWLLHRFQSPGPLLFVQPRKGAGDRTFPCYKFRTMHGGHGREGEQAKVGDDRIFPAGRWLRRTSLDEFPQFLNVLRGEMSVVGPRPHFVEHDAHFESIDPLYRLRKFVKPGITGLAQVAGYRGETKTRADVRGRSYTDLEYLENWSLRLDLVIVLKTIGAVFRPPRTAR